MAMGFLGRGRTAQAMHLRSLHVLGSALGGALAGGVLGFVGAGLGLSSWRPWIIGAAALVATAISLRRRPVALGRQRQVPRAWNKTMPPRRRYFLWGAMLGSGWATLIPYSAYLLLAGTQLTAGVVFGALSGAVFGATRQGLAPMFSLLRTDHEAVMDLLPDLRATARHLNVLVTLGGGLILVLTTWR
jgi:hypothetical protein